jgi:hypothetical protein
MRTWQMAAAAALIAAAGVVVTIPAPALAAGVVTCEDVGASPTPNINVVNCELSDTLPRGEVWVSSINILSGQDMATMTGTCRVNPTTPYYVHVSYTSNGVPASASTTVTCETGGRV